VFTHDGVNASAAANRLYARIVGDRFQELLDGAGGGESALRPARFLAEPFRTDHLERALQIPVKEAMLAGEWERRDPGPLANPSNHSAGIPDSPQYAPANWPHTAPVVSASSPRFTAFSTPSRKSAASWNDDRTLSTVRSLWNGILIHE